MRLSRLALGCCLLPFAVWAAPPERVQSDDAWLEALHRQVHGRWRDFSQMLGRLGPEYQDPDRTVEVALVIARDGTVASIERVRASGLPGFDDAPLDVLRDLGSLPAPPDSVKSDDGNTYLRWTFVRREPGCEGYRVVDHPLPIAEAVPRLVAANRPTDAIGRVVEEEHEHPDRAEALLRLLADSLVRAGAASSQPEERQAACLALPFLDGGEAILVALGRDPSATVRAAAWRGLGRLRGSSAARDALLAGLASAPAIVAPALAELGDPAALPALRDALARASAPEELARALMALGDAAGAERVVEALLGGDAIHRLAGAQAAAVLHTPRLGPTLAGLAAEPGDVELQRTLLAALAPLANRATPEMRLAIARGLRAAAPSVRAQAFAAMARLPDRATLKMRYRYIDGIANPAPEVRRAAAARLVIDGGAPVRDEVARAARDRDATVRVAVAQALLAHPFPGSALLVGRLQQDKEPSVRLAAAPLRAAATVAAAPTVHQLFAELEETSRPSEWLLLTGRWFARRR